MGIKPHTALFYSDLQLQAIALADAVIHKIIHICTYILRKRWKTTGEIKKEPYGSELFWCPNSDSNAGPPPCDDGALTN